MGNPSELAIRSAGYIAESELSLVPIFINKFI